MVHLAEPRSATRGLLRMSKKHFLEFEQPIAELETKIDELRYVQSESAVDISEEIDRLGKKSQQLTKDIYANVLPWQVYQIARHPQRPQTLDYCNEVFTEFQELHGDRHFADDAAIVGGLARFNGQACMVIGHQTRRGRQGAHAAQLRHAPSRGLPQGAAPDEAGREVRPAGLHVHRHAGRVPRHRRRGARPIGSDRPQHLRDGAAGSRPSSRR